MFTNYYKLNADGTDYSGNSHTATLVGSPTFGGGKIGGAIDLNGTSQGLYYTHGLGTGNINFTGSALIYVTANSTDAGTIIEIGPQVTDQAVLLALNNVSGGNDCLQVDQAGDGGTTRIFTTTRLKYNAWNHVVITKSGNTFTVVTNGTVETFTGSFTGTLNVTGSTAWSGFAYTGSSYFSFLAGNMDEVILDTSVWNNQFIKTKYSSYLGIF